MRPKRGHGLFDGAPGVGLVAASALMAGPARPPRSISATTSRRVLAPVVGERTCAPSRRERFRDAGADAAAAAGDQRDASRQIPLPLSAIDTSFGMVQPRPGSPRAGVPAPPRRIKNQVRLPCAPPQPDRSSVVGFLPRTRRPRRSLPWAVASRGRHARDQEEHRGADHRQAHRDGDNAPVLIPGQVASRGHIRLTISKTIQTEAIGGDRVAPPAKVERAVRVALLHVDHELRNHNEPGGDEEPGRPRSEAAC